MNKVIGFTGPFADANLGDYGMLLNNVLDIEQHIGRLELFTYDATFVKTLLRDYFPSLPSSVLQVQISAEFVEKVISGYEPTSYEILDATQNYIEIRDKVAKLDVLVVNGGGYLNELWCQPHRIERMLQIITPILIADELRTQIVFTGNSYGPFGAKSRLLVRILSSLQTAHFYARDRAISVPELRRIGIPESKISFVPDDLYLLNERLIRESSEEEEDPYVVFETYRNLDDLKQHQNKLHSFAESMRMQGYEVRLLPMYAGDGGQNQAAWLSKEFGWSYMPPPEGYLSVETASEVISGAQFVVCDRYHGLVLALAQRIPVIHALRDVIGDKRYYFQKSYGILDTAFFGSSFESKLFMATSPFEALERLSMGVGELKAKQEEAFYAIPSTSKANVVKLRENMLSHILEGNDQ